VPIADLFPLSAVMYEKLRVTVTLTRDRSLHASMNSTEVKLPSHDVICHDARTWIYEPKVNCLKTRDMAWK
jgi:hypothetical protein